MSKTKDYDEFVGKFKPKKTTDDCYTPPEIYEVIKNYVCERYGLTESQIVRPFYPGGDYENYEYSKDCVVLDNPPFSIFSKICEFYIQNEVKFFLFAPSLTLLSARKIWNKMNHIVCDCSIIYENGATVKTSFVTNLDEDVIFETCPELTKLVSDVVKELKKNKVAQLPKYDYPDYIITAALAQKYARYGTTYKIRKGEAILIAGLDAQRCTNKKIFGCGLLLSEKAAAEKAAAEKWELSDREWEIVKAMSELP